MNLDLPVLLEDPVLCAIAKKHKQTPALVALRYQVQRGVVVLAKSFNKKRIKENIQVMSWAVGRGVLRNILHEDHSLSVSQDFPWVKTSYLFFPMHECVVCSWWFSPPDEATGEVAWQERVQVGQKTEIFVSALHQPFILSSCSNDTSFSLFSIDKIELCDSQMAPHSSTLVWKIPWMEEPGRLPSMRSLRVRNDWVTSLSLFTFMRWRRKWQPTPVFLPGESQRQGSLVGCRLGGRTESDTTEMT